MNLFQDLVCDDGSRRRWSLKPCELAPSKNVVTNLTNDPEDEVNVRPKIKKLFPTSIFDLMPP
jgi:hypothetical protein